MPLMINSKPSAIPPRPLIGRMSYYRNPSSALHTLRLLITFFALLNIILVSSGTTLSHGFMTIHFLIGHLFILFACLHSFTSAKRWNRWIRVLAALGLICYASYDNALRSMDIQFGVGDYSQGPLQRQPQQCPAFDGVVGVCVLQLMVILVSVLWEALVVAEGCLAFKERVQEERETDLLKLEEKQESVRNQEYLEMQYSTTAASTAASSQQQQQLQQQQQQQASYHQDPYSMYVLKTGTLPGAVLDTTPSSTANSRVVDLCHGEDGQAYITVLTPPTPMSGTFGADVHRG